MTMPTATFRFDGARLALGRTTKSAPSTVAVTAGKEAAALAALKRNGCDDIAFKNAAGQLVIASGVGFERLRPQVGDAVVYRGETCRVVAVDNQANAWTERLRAMALPCLKNGAGGCATGAALGFLTLDLNFLVAFGALGLLIGVGWAVAQHLRRVDYKLLQAFGEAREVPSKK